ncbi:hypothetical protein D3C78_1678780 [compost metagenome]
MGDGIGERKRAQVIEIGCKNQPQHRLEELDHREGAKKQGLQPQYGGVVGVDMTGKQVTGSQCQQQHQQIDSEGAEDRRWQFVPRIMLKFGVVPPVADAFV